MIWLLYSWNQNISTDFAERIRLVRTKQGDTYARIVNVHNEKSIDSVLTSPYDDRPRARLNSCSLNVCLRNRPHSFTYYAHTIQRKEMFIQHPTPNTQELRPSMTKANKLRGGKLFFPYVSSGLGRGSKVLLTDGSVKLDFINGIGAHFGHGMCQAI